MPGSRGSSLPREEPRAGTQIAGRLDGADPWADMAGHSAGCPPDRMAALRPGWPCRARAGTVRLAQACAPGAGRCLGAVKEDVRDEWELT